MSTPRGLSNHRVMIAIDHLRPDGTQTFLVHLCKRLRSVGVEVLIVSLRGPGAAEEGLRPLGVQIVYAHTWRVITGLFIPLLMWHCRRFKPDAFLSLLFFSDILALPISCLCRIPRRISSQRASLVQYSRLKLLALSFSLRTCATHLCSNAHYLSREIEELCGLLSSTIRNFIPNTTAGTSINTTRSDDALIPITSVGRLENQKGFDIALQAIALSRYRNRILWHFIGEGSCEADLRQLTQRLCINQQVQFHGRVSDISPFLSHAMLYVQPSRFEGVPNALIEAISAGCPVITSNCEGCLELVRDQQSGLVFENGSPTDLARTLDAAIDSLDDMRRYSTRAQEDLRRIFNNDTLADQWLHILGVPRAKWTTHQTMQQA